MIKLKNIEVVLLILLLTPGCLVTDTNPAWSAGTVVEETQQRSDGYFVSIAVSISDHAMSVTLEGAKLVYQTGQNETIAESEIGTLNDETNRRVVVNATLSQRPKYILLKYDSISRSESVDGAVDGLVWRSGQGYVSYSGYRPEY